MKTKELENYPGYKVSDTGIIYSKKSGQPLSYSRAIGRSGIGHFLVGLWQDGKRSCFLVHQLVAVCFLPPKPFPEAIIRHLDGDSYNNDASNLAWGSWKDDIEDKRRIGTITAGTWHGASKLTVTQVQEIRARNELHRKLAAEFSVSHQTITQIKKNQIWKTLK